ncbi:MAG: DUF2802 domain-containing protein [Oleibacter sp.]|nr:DUF2802 domain-containing protein [Thalassolituus sp.]
MEIIQSLTLVHWLVVGNATVLLFVFGFMLSLKRQQLRDAQHYRNALVKLEMDQEALSKSCVGIGRTLRGLETKIKNQPSEPLLSGGKDMRFDQASRLVGLGASVEDLVENLGIARAEAELMVSMRKQERKKPIDEYAKAAIFS